MMEDLKLSASNSNEAKCSTSPHHPIPVFAINFYQRILRLFQNIKCKRFLQHQNISKRR